jgi:hypothetical protein
MADPPEDIAGDAEWRSRTIVPIIVDWVVADFVASDADAASDPRSLVPIFSPTTQNTYVVNQDARTLLSLLKAHERLPVSDLLPLLPDWPLSKVMSILLFLESNGLLALESRA